MKSLNRGAFVEVIFIRHGKTSGNIAKRYIGSTDEPLATVGKIEICQKNYPKADRVVVSPLKRCIETAELIYGKDYEVIEDLRECDFGEFENKTYEELKTNPLYIKWLKSNGTLPFPKGEDSNEFKNRCNLAYEEVVKASNETVAFVVHGGTIMSILEKYGRPKKAFFDYQIENGGCVVCDMDSSFNLYIKRII